jgi:two-component system chemotaxis response regulator CheB
MADKKLTLLLVDDSRSVIAQLQNAIQDIPEAEVIGTAQNGAEAVRAVEELKPDLVLMDIVMPDMDGLAALRLLQAKPQEVRVAMVSSIGGMPSKAEEAFRLGAIQVIAKPFDREVLEALFLKELERLQS